jgi:hypothetical protein
VADIKKLPDHLKAHAESMPKDLRDKLSDEELAFRLRHVHDLTLDAAAMGTPALSRRLTARAVKVRDAMPYGDYEAEKKRLEAGRDNATDAGMLDIQHGYNEALRRLDADHEQAPGIDRFLKNTVGVPPADESAADAKGADAMLFKRANIDRLVQAELAKYEEKHAAEVERIRREIAELEAAAKTGRTTPLERARTTSKVSELDAEADRFEKLAVSLTDPELSKYYMQKACETREAALRLNRKGTA